jgi:hypothetical protein
VWEGGGEGRGRGRGGRAGVRPEGQWLKVPVYTRATGVPINHWVMGMGEGG